MRPSKILLIIIVLLAIIDAGLFFHTVRRTSIRQSDYEVQSITVSGLGLTDLAVATEARYTRHPSVSDLMAPFMDHPGAIEHFPTGSFWAAPPKQTVPGTSGP
jgi:hypothetical protein